MQSRKAANLSREQLAGTLGISSESIKSVELGKGISLHTLYMICETLNVSADYILFGTLVGSANPMMDLLEGQSKDVMQGAYEIIRTYIGAVKKACAS